MQLSIITTDGKARTTGQAMHSMVSRYYQDMLPYFHLPLLEIYNIIKSLPYRADPPGEETLMRPLYTMKMRGWGGDCDDKAIALASWAVLAGLPYRFIAARKETRKNLHHVYCEIYIIDTWITADPTYNFNSLGFESSRFVEKIII